MADQLPAAALDHLARHGARIVLLSNLRLRVPAVCLLHRDSDMVGTVEVAAAG